MHALLQKARTAGTSVRGVVVQGDQRGRLLGFPTANLELDGSHTWLVDGVYAALVRCQDGTTYPAAVSVGRRPTFYVDASVRLLEAHLLDFGGDLYGQTVDVALITQIRPQQRFGSVDELTAQLARDVERTRELIAAAR